MNFLYLRDEILGGFKEGKELLQILKDVAASAPGDNSVIQQVISQHVVNLVSTAMGVASPPREQSGAPTEAKTLISTAAKIFVKGVVKDDEQLD